MIAMDDFIRIEVDKIFPGPVPHQEGVQIELWHDKLTVLIQMPKLDQDQLRTFNKGFEQYSYLESDTPIPIALWIFAPDVASGADLAPSCQHFFHFHLLSPFHQVHSPAA